MKHLHHSFLTLWSFSSSFLQHVQAGPTKPQDIAVERREAEAENGQYGSVLGKRQELCVYDSYLEVLDDLALATELCAQIVGLPAVTVVEDFTPVITSTVVTGTRTITTTNIERITDTVTAIVTQAASNVEKRAAEPNAEPMLALAEARDAAAEIIASATASPGVVEAFSSACNCRDIPASTTVTSTYTVLPQVATVAAGQREVVTVNVTRIETFTTTITVVDETTDSTEVETMTESEAVPFDVVSMPTANPELPISPIVSCPDLDNQTISVLVGSVRFDALVLCDMAITSGDDLIGLPYTSVTQCAAACARVNEGSSDTVCKGVTFDTSAAGANSCFLKQSASVLASAPDNISLIFAIVAASDDMTSYNRVFNDEEPVPSSTTTVNATVLSSVFSTSMSFVTPPPETGGNSTVVAANMEANASVSQSARFSWSYSSAWYTYYATSWYTVYASTVYSSEFGSVETVVVGSGSGMGGGSGEGAGESTAIDESTITSDVGPVFTPVTTIVGSSSDSNMSSEATTTIWNGNEMTVIFGSTTIIRRLEGSAEETGGAGTGNAASMNWTSIYASWPSAETTPVSSIDTEIMMSTLIISGSGAYQTSGMYGTGGSGALPTNTTMMDPSMTDDGRAGTASTTTGTNTTTPLTSTFDDRTGLQSLSTGTPSTPMNITSFNPTAPPSTTMANTTVGPDCACPTIDSTVTEIQTVTVVNCAATECYPFYQAFSDWHTSHDDWDGSDFDHNSDDLD